MYSNEETLKSWQMEQPAPVKGLQAGVNENHKGQKKSTSTNQTIINSLPYQT